MRRLLLPAALAYSFFQSFFFGFPEPTDAQNVLGGRTWDFSYGVQVVPEPATVFMLAAGLGAMATRSKRKQA